MGLTVGMVTIDCAQPQQLAEFWTAALGVGVQGDYGDFVFLQRPTDGGPVLGLQRVPEPRSGKNREHVELTGGAPAPPGRAGRCWLARKATSSAWASIRNRARAAGCWRWVRAAIRP